MSVPHGWDAVTVLRAPFVTERGTTVRDWEAAETWEIAGCNVQPSSTSRDFEGRALQVEDSWTLYAPEGADIAAGDRIGYDGSLFEVDGEPMARRSPTGRISHVQVQLKRWEG